MITVQVSEQDHVDRIVRNSQLLEGDETGCPKSMQKRIPGASTRMRVLNRPPEPNESPEPAKVMLTDIV